MPRSFLFSVVCIGFFLLASVQAQEEAEKVPTLDDAKTLADFHAYIRYEATKHDLNALTPKERDTMLADLCMVAGDTMLKNAKTISDKQHAYRLKFTAFDFQLQAKIESAEQKIDLFLKELASMEDFVSLAYELRLQYLMRQTEFKGIEKTGQEIEALLEEVVEWGKKNKQGTGHILPPGQFFLFRERALKAEASPENYDLFKSELEQWIGKEHTRIPEMVSFAAQIAHRNGISAEQFNEELSGYIQSQQRFLGMSDKDKALRALKFAVHFFPGSTLKFYGKTLDNEDVNWESFRGKYVLIKFTATWCGSCKMQIPGMVEAYEKYHDKGLEIISVFVAESIKSTKSEAELKEYTEEELKTYIGEIVNTYIEENLKKYIAENKIPWITVSEKQTMLAGQPDYMQHFGFRSVPTIVLMDKEGKIIMPPTHYYEWKTKLAEIFE